MKTVPFTSKDSSDWDNYLPHTAQGNFLHSRRFLNYHGDRFEDRSLVIKNDNDKIVALFPAATDPNDSKAVISHPGTTHAGLLHGASLRAVEAAAAFANLCESYAEAGVKKLTIKPVPGHLCRILTGLEAWTYWRSGGEITRFDLWNSTDLMGSRRLSKGQKWSMKKARDAGITLRDGQPKDLTSFYGILCSALESRHNTQPVHSEKELEFLIASFTDEISLRLAEHQGTICGGVLLFKFGQHAIHSQYIANTEFGRENFALNYLLEDCISTAGSSGARVFSFGASTESAGLTLNEGLYGFKAGFGAGSASAPYWSLCPASSAATLRKALQ